MLANRLRQTGSGLKIPLSDLQIWLKADAGVILDGNGNVSQWSDVSGNNRHATQGTSANRPSFLASGINGKPALVGDGINDTLNWAAFSSGTNHNFYIVAAFDTGLNSYSYAAGFFGSFNVPSSHDMFFYDTSANPEAGSRQTTAKDTIFIPANNSANIKSGITAIYSFYRNGGNYAAKWSHNSKVSWTVTGTAATGITGNRILFGNYYAVTSFRIAEVVCYSRDLTQAEETTLSTYFQAKYGYGI